MVTLSSYAAYTQETCPYRVQPTGCECIGSNDALGEYERARHGQDYGKWCAAWEDGKIDPNATAVGTPGTRPIHTALLHCTFTPHPCFTPTTLAWSEANARDIAPALIVSPHPMIRRYNAVDSLALPCYRMVTVMFVLLPPATSDSCSLTAL